jgi:hypothetical protein
LTSCLIGCGACTTESEGGSDAGSVSVLPLKWSVLIPADTNLGRIKAVAIGRDHLWAVASGDPLLVRYRFDGTAASYPLRVGDGPAQARFAASLDVDDYDNAYIWDGILGRIMRIAPSDQVDIVASGPHWRQINQVPTWEFLGGTINQLAVLSDRILLGMIATTTNGSGDLSRTVVASLAKAGQDSILSFGRLNRWIDSTGGGRRFAPFPLWTRCGRSHLAVYDPSSTAVKVLDSSGLETRRIEVSSGFQVRSDSLARALFFHRLLASTQGAIPLAQIMQRVFGAPSGALKEAASVLPKYVNLLCTPSGVVFLQRLEVSMTKGPGQGRWEMREPNRLPTLIELPGDLTLVAADDERLIAIQADSFDVATIVVAEWPR